MVNNNVDLVVQVNISLSTLATGVSSLDLALVLAKNLPDYEYTGQSKLYTPSGLDEVARDFGSSSDEYKAISAFFSSDIKPSKIRVGLRDSAVATVKEIRFDDNLAAGQKIQATINGVKLTDTTFDTDMATTLTAFATKVAAVIGIASAVTGTKKVTVTATTEYSLDIACSVFGTPTRTVDIHVSTAGHSVVDDYLAIQEEVDDWYAVLAVDRDNGLNYSIAKKVLTERKQYSFASDDSNILDLTSADIFSKMKAASLGRASGLWHQDLTEFPDFAWWGSCLGYKPGAISWADKKLSGVTASKNTVLSSSAIDNVLNKFGNVYMAAGNAGLTRESRTFDGNLISVVRGIDYFHNLLQNQVFNLLTSLPRLPYNRAGIASVKQAMTSAFDACVKAGILSSDPGFTYVINMPDIKDVSTADKAANILKNVTFTAYVVTDIITVQIDGKILL